jgi:oligopeptide transport system substrate-binding protein
MAVAMPVHEQRRHDLHDQAQAGHPLSAARQPRGHSRGLQVQLRAHDAAAQRSRHLLLHRRRGGDAYQAGKAAHISGYKALDKYTIEIDLEQPDLAFLNALTVDFCDPIPKEWVAKWGNQKVGRHPLGTGPFMFESWTPGQEIVLSRNPNYRDAAHVWLDGIKFELADTAQSAFLKLQRGDVDVLGNNVPPANVLSVMNSPEWKPYVYREPVIGTIYLFLNVQFPPLDNVTVRQAISWAIDRDKLVKLLTGEAQPLYQVYPPGMPGYQADKKWYGYDPAKAKQLLAQAGFANGFKTTLYTDNVDPYPKLFQSIQNDLARWASRPV